MATSLMALTTGGMGRRSLPDEKHLAFAVSVVLSKPSELTIEEYIGLLRQHVAKGRRENALSSVHRHLDRSSYWRSEYERVKETLESAEKERSGLKVEIDRLKAGGGTALSSNPAKKRKKPDDADVVPVPRSPKRPRPAMPVKEAALTASNVDAGFSFAHLGEPGGILMRSFYQIHALLKSHKQTNPVSLAHHLIRAASSVSDVLQSLAKKQSKNEGADLDTLKSVLTAVSRAMHSLLIGYSRISNVTQGVEMQGQIVYAYVQILEKCTIMLSDFAKAAVRDTEVMPLQERPASSKGKSKLVTVPTVKRTKNAALGTVTGFIADSIDVLDAKVDAHKPLFEGLAYVLIEKLATCLYTLNFGHDRPATIEEEIAAAVQPDDIGEAGDTASAKPSEMAVKVAKLEAPYLIQLLTRLMQVAPTHLGASGTTKAPKSKVAIKQGPSKDNLAITAKERLQRTLVNCMFGTEGVDDEDPFLDCLRKPACGKPLPSVPIVTDADIQEWFKEEVWRLLGWDILAREGGW